MVKQLLAAIAVALALAVTPASTQQNKAPTSSELVGLTVYSSDGHNVGEVTSASTATGKTSLRVEMGSFLGMGPSQVLVDPGVFQPKDGRIELKITAAEVKERISRQNQSK